jgi:hypothetical protein
MSDWRNGTENGDLYNTSIRSPYKDEKSGEWRGTRSFSPTDLAILAQLSAQTFAEIGKVKQHGGHMLEAPPVLADCPMSRRVAVFCSRSRSNAKFAHSCQIRLGARDCGFDS